jgi:endonuclease/exonuclease/phosphatase family metal-dependent hydrolase
MARRRAAWGELDDLDADVALLQEASRPEPAAAFLDMVPHATDSWETAGLGSRLKWRTAIIRLTNPVELRPRINVEISTSIDDWVVSRGGSITAADVVTNGSVSCTAVSVYAAWETAGKTIFADGSAHRILSDLSVLMGRRDHRLIVAGDWNLLRGYGEVGNAYWKARYDTVFERADALGLRFVGPQHPNGRQADPWPDELPDDSLCVPTFHHSRQTPATATRQLDFVFASTSIADRVDVRALNTPDAWGPSDHCRVLIDLHD